MNARRVTLVFFAAALILSLHSIPYELAVCSPPPPHGDDSPEALAAGTASTPYQYRALVPWIVRGAVEMHLLERQSELAAFAVIQVVALILLAFAFRRYLKLFIADQVIASVAALTIYAILPFNYFNLPYYPYDIPSVMFFTLGLVLIRERKWALFYPLFVAATFNRETSIFLAVAMTLALFDKYRWPSLGGHLLAQATLWAVIKLFLRELYSQNRWLGYGLYQFQLKVNIATLLNFPVKGIIALATWACLWLAVVVWYRRVGDEFLRRNLWTIPVFILAMFVVGFVIELRIYGEVLPIVLAAFWVALLDVIRERFSVAERPGVIAALD